MAAGGGEVVPEVIRELMVVERSVGSTLSPSLKSPGGLSPLVHGASGVREQVVLYATNAIEKSSGSGTREKVILAAVVAGVSIGGTLLVVKGVPKIKQFLADKKLKTQESEIAEAAASEVEVSTALPSTELRQVEDEVDVTAVELTKEQWFALFFESLAHRAAGRAHAAISVEQWETLVSARILNDEGTQSLASALRELTPEQINEKVDLILEAHPDLLTEDPEVVVERVFGDGADALLMPVQRSEVTEATQTFVENQPAD
ncbi:hypothetical protein QBL02_06335 [Leucobacter sp. UT-8R-CII-1-4]|uniref:hypothetical protein n=1 Tax=Leucobacter sp. UT-8R-CII-1-4 TaxID=3040075 RepID=UPI0024A9B8FB|nr:hypothetical protein [Leucobacter sp. UT-8R-CII-1-4]MDI6023160.1 hypothetical protein [Leucobacter sp. UT-8R-CII-1-4]